MKNETLRPTFTWGMNFAVDLLFGFAARQIRRRRAGSDGPGRAKRLPAIEVGEHRSDEMNGLGIKRNAATLLDDAFASIVGRENINRVVVFLL